MFSRPFVEKIQLCGLGGRTDGGSMNLFGWSFGWQAWRSAKGGTRKHSRGPGTLSKERSGACSFLGLGLDRHC